MNQEMAESIVAQAADDLKNKLGPDAQVIVIVGPEHGQDWGYAWSFRGYPLPALGLLSMGSRAIEVALMSLFGKKV